MYIHVAIPMSIHNVILHHCYDTQEGECCDVTAIQLPDNGVYNLMAVHLLAIPVI